MSRLTGSEAQSLMEAYAAVYASKEEEVVQESTEELNEAPMTAFQAAGGQAKLDQLNRGRSPRAGRATAAQLERQGQENLFRAGGGNAAIAQGPTRNQNVRGGGTVKVPTLTRQDIINRGTVAAAKPKFGTTTPKGSSVTSTGVTGLSAADRAAYSAGGGNAAAQKGMGKSTADVIKQGKLNLSKMDQGKRAPAGAKPTSGPSSVNPKTGLSAGPAAKPAAAAAAKPAAPAATKPTAPAAAKPTAPAAKPAGSAMDQFAKANPKLAASAAERDRTRGTSATTNPLMKDMKANLPAPKSPAPSTAKTGFDLAKKGVNLAASVDIFDLVKGHLLDEGYADTEDAALAIMANMSEEWKQSILEG